jgi:hypothetical protein
VYLYINKIYIFINITKSSIMVTLLHLHVDIYLNKHSWLLVGPLLGSHSDPRPCLGMQWVPDIWLHKNAEKPRITSRTQFGTEKERERLGVG